MRILIRLIYDGTSFHGWQIQPGLPTIQQAVEDAVEKLCGRHCTVNSAGRTDTGVHALSMPAHLDVREDELSRIRNGLNSYLPTDIRCISADQVSDDFSARFNALSRNYRYRIGKIPHPFTRFFEYQPDKVQLNTELMGKAAEMSLGSNSWKGFAKEGSGNSSWLMNVTEARVEEDVSGWNFFITANRFLRGVVRIWSGTLLRIGCGRIPPDTVKNVISVGNRSLAGPSLPACGLTLVNVEYENEI